MEPLNIILLITIIVGILAILYITIYNKLQTEKSKINTQHKKKEDKTL